MDEGVEKYSADHCHKVAAEKPSNGTRNTLALVSGVCALFLVAELLGGILSNSLAILTDVAHLASDLTSFVISLVALWLAKKPPTKTMTFGYHRAEIFGAAASVIFIWIMTAILVYLAVQRVIHRDYVIQADTMLITSSVGILFNVIMGLLLNLNAFKKCKGLNLGSHVHSHGLGGSHGHSHGLDETDAHGHSHTDGLLSKDKHKSYRTLENEYDTEKGEINGNVEEQSGDRHGHHSDGVTKRKGFKDSEEKGDKGGEKKDKTKNILLRAAFIHVIGDLIQSIGVFVAAIIIKCKPDYTIVDPICTFVFSVLVMITTSTVIRDAVYVLMEAAPRNIDILALQRDMEGIPGVQSVHSLQIWALTVNKNAVVMHLAVDDQTDQNEVLSIATGMLYSKYSMHQCHVQTERWQPEIMNSCQQCKSV